MQVDALPGRLEVRRLNYVTVVTRECLVVEAAAGKPVVFLGHREPALGVEADAQDVAVQRRAGRQAASRFAEVAFEVRGPGVETGPGVPVGEAQVAACGLLVATRRCSASRAIGR
jgi:hypothetical protein